MTNSGPGVTGKVSQPIYTTNRAVNSSRSPLTSAWLGPRPAETKATNLKFDRLSAERAAGAAHLFAKLKTVAPFNISITLARNTLPFATQPPAPALYTGMALPTAVNSSTTNVTVANDVPDFMSLPNMTFADAPDAMGVAEFDLPIYTAITTKIIGDCSGTILKTQGQRTVIITSTVLVNETTMLAPNATTPPPLLITPLPACVIVTSVCISLCPEYTEGIPGGKHQPVVIPPATSTLLVTKKSPAIINQGQAVGPLFGSPTTTAQAIGAQQNTNGKQDDASDAQPTTIPDQDSGSPTASSTSSPAVPNAAGPSSEDPSSDIGASQQGAQSGNTPSAPSPAKNAGSQSSSSDQSSGNAASQQEAQTGSSPSKGSTAGNSDSQSSNSGQPSGNVESQQGAQSGNTGSTAGNLAPLSSNGGQYSGNEASQQEAQDGNKGSTAGNSGAQSSDGGQSSGNVAPQQEAQNGNIGSTAANSGSKASGDGQSSGNIASQQEDQNGNIGSTAGYSGSQQTSSDSNPGQTAGEGNQATPGGASDSKISASNQLQSNQPSSGQSLSSQVVSGNSGSMEAQMTPGSDVSVTSADQSNTGQTTGSGENPNNEYDFSSQSGGSSDPGTNQYVPGAVTVGGIPISHAANGMVFVGSQTINAGTPPTTVVANGQSIAVEPSQIVAPGTTIPIQAVVTPAAASSVIVGNVPVVLQPSNVIIGSLTFNHGSAPTSVIYNGQTYNWDATQLSASGTIVAFPSVDSASPLVTAGGQVFSVYPSILKASGTDIAIPNTPSPSPFVYDGQTFSVNPSQLIAPDTSIALPTATTAALIVYNGQTVYVDSSQFAAASTTIPLSSGSRIVTYNGQILSIGPSQIVGPATTIALSDSPEGGNGAQPSAITTGGLTFSLGPSAAIVGPSTYSFLPGQTPAKITDNGQTITVGPKGVQFGSVDIPIPTDSSSYSEMVEGDLTFSVAPSKVVLDGHTNDISSGMAPITTVIDGQTVSIGPQGVGLASTTVPLPTPKPSFSVLTEGNLTFSIAPSEAVIDGETFSVSPNKVPVTAVINGQTVSVGPSGIVLKGTTVNLPTLQSVQTPAVVTADGLTFSMGPTNAIIGGTAYPIGSGAPSETIAIGSETLRVGSDGVMLPSTTFPPEQTPSPMTAGGLTFSADPNEAIINGTIYAIGSGALAETIVAGSETIRLGTKGIAFPSTTIEPWITVTSGFSSVFVTSGILSDTSAPPSATKLPRPQSTGDKGNAKPGAGVCLRPPDSVLLSILLGGLIFALISFR